MKLKSLLLFVTILVLLVGLASASEVSTDTISTHTDDLSVDAVSTDTTFSTVMDTTPTTTESVQESVTGKQIENKIITKEEKNKKTAVLINVGDYDNLTRAFMMSGDVIVNITANITLTDSPNLSFSINTLTIEGNGFTINGSNTHRFLVIRSQTNTVNINNLTITNCYDYDHRFGGAINNEGTLTITNSNLNNNTATDSYGGAIFNEYGGTIIITNSNLTHNTAKFGGAIYNYNGGTINITDSNFTHNKATELGGAIDNDKATINMNNTNLNYNTVNYGGGAINNEGTLTITDSNLTHNTATDYGAIRNVGGTYEITDTIFYNNTPANFIINQYNHIQLITNDNYISVGDFAIIVDDTVKGTGTGTADFKNIIVPMGDNIKLIFNGTNMTNNTYILQSNTRNVADYPALIAAIEEAKQNKYNKFIINLQPGGNYNATDNIRYEDSLTKDITINGNGQTVNGQNIHQFINIATEHNLTLENITITNYTADEGGAIYNGGTLNITDSNLNHNNATFGGAIYNQGTLTITDSNLNHNTASRPDIYQEAGGAIYSNGNLNIKNTNFTHNIADYYGGAILSGGAFNITDSNFKYNNAAWGGAIDNEYATLNITNTNFTYNTASSVDTTTNLFGGAIKNGHGTLIISDSNFNHNNAIRGGAIYNNDGTLIITNSNLTHNTATGEYGWGGAIFILGRSINITHSKFTYNNATQRGGAIYERSSFRITDSDFTHNTATNGSAIYSEGPATIYENTFTNNLAKSTREGAIIDDGRDTIIGNNTNANSSKYNSTIYTNNYQGNVYPLNITFNTFDDQPRNTTITISTNNTTTPKVTDIINITLELKDDFDLPVKGENITVTINQNTRNLTTDSNGIASMEYQVISNETVINATYSGNGSYYNATNTVLTLVAEKMETKLLVDDVSALVGKAFTINGTLLDINNKAVVGVLVNITVNGTKTNATTNAEGQFNTTITLQEMGEYPINVVFYENSGYKESNNNTAKVTASKTDTHITLKVSNNTPVNDTVITITVNLTDDTGEPLDNQEVDITIGEETFTINTTNGIASRQYTVNKTGTQTITASYTGNNMYNANSTKTDINVIKLDTKLTLIISNNTPVNNTPITITATLTDTANNKLEGKNITLNINGKNQTITTNNNGTATQTYTPTALGKQTITATYNGDSQYNNSTKQSTQINVIKLDTKLTLKVSNTTPINSTAINITATLTDTKGNKLANQNITIKVSDKTYTVKTNTNGTAIKTYTPTKVEKQTITATYKGNSKYTGNTATINITVKKINTKLDLKASNTTPVNNTPITITATLTDTSNNKLANQNITLNINGKTVTTKTNANGTVTRTYTPTNTGKQNITAAYNGDSKYTNSTKTTTITVRNKYNTKTVTKTVTGVIGEKLTLTATVTDTNNNKINEGNLIFKINGVTIKDNGKLTGSNNPLKVKVTNGVATATITPDLNMVNSDKITASYIGTTIYNASTSTPASIKISKRNATIEISTNKKIVKQGQVLTITAKIYDTTGGRKSTNLAAYSDEFVYFKINGVTVKDEKGEMLKVKVVNGVARLNYTVPLGISCVLDTQSMTPKNHTIQVGFYNKNYQDIISNNPHFQVERSNITINLANATINNKTHKLSMKITIKDYLGNVVAGPNKLIIKVNGVTLKNGTQVMYYYTTDGVLDLKNTLVPHAKNYTSVEVITQDRLAYKSQRNTTTVIKMTN